MSSSTHIVDPTGRKEADCATWKAAKIGTRRADSAANTIYGCLSMAHPSQLHPFNAAHAFEFGGRSEFP